MNTQDEEKARESLRFIEQDITRIDERIALEEDRGRNAQSAVRKLTLVRDALLKEAQVILDRLDGRTSP
ncbi:hypothetical protein [Azospirillum rugosum]|uniref:Uncharacterized protein n=1 Tax=Azospirillum rugosum TaxID=416170 RepID=A0ABS4SSH2_9PROT|nr:hypothetical protein [Azospirillum rugosum]MBP2295502.1 hypothetical protein [Azospirillum rugosum]MDQ0528381.1 hypothetical protein [Azospirillum rugosum]